MILSWRKLQPTGEDMHINSLLEYFVSVIIHYITVIILYYNDGTIQRVLWDTDRRRRVFLEEVRLEQSPKEGQRCTREQNGEEKKQIVCYTLWVVSDSAVSSWRSGD